MHGEIKVKIVYRISNWKGNPLQTSHNCIPA
jgi:hypothetical protein